LDIFNYEIINDYYIKTKMMECIELDKNNGLNSNQYYIKFIESLPWTAELEILLNTYTNCEQLMENHFKKKPDKPNIVFGTVPTKYNKIYYDYVLQTSEACTECQKYFELCCPIYNKLSKFIDNKFKKK
jgi:hypothetical protein